MKRDKITKALKLFELDIFNLDRLNKQYRVLALRHHPDRGGDALIMQEVNDMKDFLLDLSSQDIDSYRRYYNHQLKKQKKEIKNKKKKIKVFENYDAPFAKMSKRSKKDIEKEISEKRNQYKMKKEDYRQEKKLAEEMEQMYFEKYSKAVEVFTMDISKYLSKKIGINKDYRHIVKEPNFYSLFILLKFDEYSSVTLKINYLFYRFDDKIGITIKYIQAGVEEKIVEDIIEKENLSKTLELVKKHKLDLNFI